MIEKTLVSYVFLCIVYWEYDLVDKNNIKYLLVVGLLTSRNVVTVSKKQRKT